MLQNFGTGLAYLLSCWFVLAFSMIVAAGIYFAGVIIYYLVF